MGYPKISEPREVGFVLSHDVERQPDCSYSMAQIHAASGLCLFSDYYLRGAAAALSLGLIEHMVIVGGKETRYPNDSVVRPTIMRDLLITQHGVAPSKIKSLVSPPNAVGNARKTRQWMEVCGMSDQDIVILASIWHIPITIYKK